ncbi:hypothetical protein SAMN05421788_11373 [Filimonas lacunae]|uniref:DUF1449 family protein n=1 Tax=Filimonas lacunae TaxID=477680 RepID=A0A173MBR8_9BACT|nr:OB-fold-containig protein [Filimonas lacunae]BAV04972.1 hypothetical protein FLA_0977 [Filimonas lacunae]SIT33713.1 hypothetical protein SAMN05421788_11373 [Filimonas lacunae]
MSELVELLFHPLSNAIMTVLTGITAVYWVFTFMAHGLFGDHDVEADLHTHGADLDTDTDTDVHEPDGGSFFHDLLDFVNVGKMPFMVVYSTFKFIAWIITLVSSLLLGLASWGWKSVFILLPVLVVAFILTRFATKPLVKLYNLMGYNGEEGYDLMGRTAKMRSTIQGSTIGAAELYVKSDLIRVMVKSKTGEPIAFNAEVTLAGESEDKKYYLVIPEITLNNIV